MPILVKDYTWTQSEARVCINLPLKGTKSTNLDIVNSLEFVKVSYPPYLFECWFYDKIKDENCSAIINNGFITVQFNKEEEKTWPKLCHDSFPENKELTKQLREAAIVFAGERANRLAKQKLDDQAANKKESVKEQMKLEEGERTKIERTKQEERQRATEEIEKFKLKSLEMAEPAKVEKPASKPESGDKFKAIFDDAAPITAGNKKVSVDSDKAVPEPRASGRIQINFTPRVFPTPSRESQDQNEKEWLKNQAEARQKSLLPDELKDLSENEQNLEWLKEKANSFYKQDNYQTAIGVYNHAIKIFPKNAALYSNRAACHYKVRNLIKCVEDCTRALDLLNPPVEANAASRLRAHVRRGTAFCELELYAEGLLDYEAAIKLDPTNEEIKADALNIRQIIQGSCTLEPEE